MQTPNRTTTACVIVGAGFSYVAGLPLTKDLFDSDLFAASTGAARRHRTVEDEWRVWKAEHMESGPEQFLDTIYSQLLGTIDWSSAVEYVAATLATPLRRDRGAQNLRYAGRITRPVRVREHDAFWDCVLSGASVGSVITTNYDILIERGLRHRPMKRYSRPGVHYGGFARPQFLKGVAQPFSVANPDRVIELSGELPLYKLHGSLSWGTEQGELKFYQDYRSAFRRGGNAQIVPPTVEKIAPAWLSDVWAGAREALSQATSWLVCGYSLPQYDVAITSLFSEAARLGNVQTIVIMDPYADAIACRWNAVAPRAMTISLAGLPESLPQLRSLLPQL
jgi:hypothetical protein